MKAAIVIESGKAPLCGDFTEPVPEAGEVQVTVTAAALSNVVRSRASARHYSFSGDLPSFVGIDDSRWAGTDVDLGYSFRHTAAALSPHLHSPAPVAT